MTAVDPSAAAPPNRGLPTLAKVLIAVGVVVVLFVLLGVAIVMGVFAMTSGPVKASDAFFAATAQSGPAVSYNLASPSFRSVVPEAKWEAYAKQYGLSGYTGASWSSRSINNNVAVLKGSLKVAGGALPATIQLTNGGSGWQVLHLDLADGGVASTSAATMADTPANSGSSDAAATPTPAMGDQGSTSTSEASDTSAPPTPPPAAAGGLKVPGAQLAGLCKTVLAQQAQATFDSIECPDALAARPGATTACMVRKGSQSALMTARLDTFDPATRHFTVDCKVADHPLS